MKKTIILTIAFFFIFAGLAFADAGYVPPKDKEEPEEEEGKLQSICPITLMDRSCCVCHSTPHFRLIEASPDEGRNYPNGNMKIRDNIGYYYLKEIESTKIADFFGYLKRHNISQAVIEIQSPGGSLFDAWELITYMMGFDGTVETRVRSYAASAGCLIFLGGDIGNRFVSPTATLMWHELLTFKFLAIETPSSTEDEAKVLRFLQDTLNEWIASRSKLTKEQIDDVVKRKEFWINGKQAVETYGFADGFIGEKQKGKVKVSGGVVLMFPKIEPQ